MDNAKEVPLVEHDGTVASGSSGGGPLGLIAGNGVLPLEVARRARELGRRVVVVAHRDESSPELQEIASEFTWVKVGQIKKAISFLERHRVVEVAFAGGIRRPKLFRNLSLDTLALAIIASTRSLKDDALLRGVASEMEKRGIRVISPGAILTNFVAPHGLLTSRALSSEELEQARIGWEAAACIGRLDIGQAVAVAGGVVVAVEAIEGTDAMLRRAGSLSPKGFVVVKRAKPHQDLRLDLPAIGPTTVATMAAAGGTALVVEARKAFLLDPAALVHEANSRGIAVCALTAQDLEEGVPAEKG